MLFRDHWQISILLFHEYKGKSQLLFPLKSSENLWFSDDFRGYRSWFIGSYSLGVRKRPSLFKLSWSDHLQISLTEANSCQLIRFYFLQKHHKTIGFAMISGGVIIELNDLNSFSDQVLCIFLTNLQIIFTEVRNPFSGILLNSYCKNFNFFDFSKYIFHRLPLGEYFCSWN